MCREVSGDDDLKGKLVAYTWSGGGQVRAMLVGKARSGVAVWYKLSGLQGNDLKEVVDWLLEDEAFLHDGIDLEARTYDKSRIWMNNAFACLIEDTFWSAKGDAVRMGKKGNTYLELPDPLLSICVVAMKCAFKGIRDTCSIKGIVHFTDATYGPQWRYYMDLLEKFKKDSPTYYNLIKLEL
ncbi:hypothetical protein M405DRAFT_863385 [Rhizopogon salebrosus TDB-379]|nr:hypothetical protein M405DRAFT_863385 [Rhizopogon salebrosus TDB-379]